MEESILVHPDFSKMFKLYTNTLDIELGVILMQENDQGKDRVIYYETKTLLLVEKNYSTIEKECLAIIWAMQKFKHFLRRGQLFEVYTDHTMLKILMIHENPYLERLNGLKKWHHLTFWFIINLK